MVEYELQLPNVVRVLALLCEMAVARSAQIASLPRRQLPSPHSVLHRIVYFVRFRGEETSTSTVEAETLPRTTYRCQDSTNESITSGPT